MNGNVRFHEIYTTIPLEIREGGFSLLVKEPEITLSKDCAKIKETHVSQIIAIEGYEEAGIQVLEPNTSVFFPRTNLPYLKKENRTWHPSLYLFSWRNNKWRRKK